MRNKPRKPTLPPERGRTIRREIIALLEAERVSAKEISTEVGIPEKEVAGHLKHVRMTLDKDGRALRVEPARCRGCGFEFRKRKRLNKPGRCPVCRGESIVDPVYSINS